MSRPRRVLEIVATVAIAACDIPTDIPKWDTEFLVPAENTTLGVWQLLPSSMGVTSNGTRFSLELSPAGVERELRALCAACGAVDGIVVPKPAFRESIQATVTLPADVKAGALAGGAVRVTLENGFNFDPLRPGGANGTAHIRVHSGATTLGTLDIDGATLSLPPGTSVPVIVPLTAGSVNSAVSVTVTFDSPLGSPVRIEADDRMKVTASPTGVTVSSAKIRVVDRQVTVSPVQMKLSGIDAFVTRRVRSGVLKLSITNPFNCSGSLTLKITGGNTVVTKSVVVTAGTSKVDIPLTQTDMEAMLGHDVELTATGPVSATDDVSVTPAQTLSLDSRLKFVLASSEE